MTGVLPRATRRVAGVLAALTWLVISACVVVLVLGVVIAVGDQSNHDDAWDGLGTGLAVAAAAFFVPLLIACGVLLAALTKGLRHEDAAVLHAAGRTTMVACGAMALVGLPDVLVQGRVGPPETCVDAPGEGALERRERRCHVSRTLETGQHAARPDADRVRGGERHGGVDERTGTCEGRMVVVLGVPDPMQTEVLRVHRAPYRRLDRGRRSEGTCKRLVEQGESDVGRVGSRIRGRHDASLDAAAAP